MHQVISTDTEPLRIPKQCKFAATSPLLLVLLLLSCSCKFSFIFKSLLSWLSLSWFLFLSFQLTEFRQSLRSSPLLRHQRADADKTDSAWTEEPMKDSWKTTTFLFSSPPLSWYYWICLSTSSTSLFPVGHLPGFPAKYDQEFLRGVNPCISRRIHLSGLLRYPPAAGDQKLAPNIVLNMHHTAGPVVTADVVTSLQQWAKTCTDKFQKCFLRLVMSGVYKWAVQSFCPSSSSSLSCVFITLVVLNLIIL